MTDKQMNYVNMADTTIDVMDANLALWTSNTKITTAYNGVKATLLSIHSAELIQSQNISGATVTKHQLWAVAVNKAEHVCAGLKAYFDDINDAINYGIISFSKSDFESGSVNVVTSRMQLVHDKAAGIIPANLTPFNVVAADITGLQTAIDNFKNAAPNRTSMRAVSSAATSQLVSLFTALRLQMKKLDNLIGTMKQAQPLFAATYQNARKIINLGKTQQTIDLHLMPHHFESAFGRKFSEGDTFTIRNHSAVPIMVGLTDTPSVMPTLNLIKITSTSEVKVSVSKDFGGVFGHWLMVHNFMNDLDDVNVVILLAHGNSESNADVPGNIA